MNKLFSVIIFVFVLSIPATAQKKHTKAADDAFNAKKYATAITNYQKAYTKVKKDPEEKNRINYQLAECYRLTNNVRRAEIQYKRLEKIKYQEKEPLILLYLADALKSGGKYSEALNYYKAYQQLVPEDIRGENGIISCTKSVEWEKNPGNYIISNLKKINTRDDDFSPAYANTALNTIVFTSGRDAAVGSQKDEWTGQNFSDLFITRIDRKGNFTPPVIFDNEDGQTDSELYINTAGNEGTPILNSNFTNIYFTRCSANNTAKQGCKIFTSSRNGQNWSRPKPLQFGNDTTGVVGHPAISRDELTIYFASDRNGGMGGKDIWVAKRKSKSENFGRPINLGPEINTPGDEMFPFLRNDTTLYFASNGHIGMGGLDIFVAVYDNEWKNVENLKLPFNSNGDDFGIVFNPEKEEGYFSSNRKGARKDDIYSFYLPVIEYSIEGTVKDENTMLFIEGAKIELASSSGATYSTQSNSQGKFLFDSKQVKSTLNYELSANKENYFLLKKPISSDELLSQENLKLDLKMIPFPTEPILLPEILYELGKWELRPQYQDSLQGLIKTMDENKNLVIELAAHTDSRDTEERNDILSQRRARSVVDYLILRGIDPDRLTAKGYGERQPRVLKQNIVKNGIRFANGTVLNESFINALRTNAEKEAAHELNRRTEFRILNKDFKPKTSKVALNPEKVDISLNPVTNEVPFELDKTSGAMLIACTLNDHAATLAFSEHLKAEISLRQALRMLNNGEITKKDFLGDAEKALANGTIANQSRLLIQKISIADKSVENIEFTVNNRLKNQLQIGSSILSKFGKFTIDKEAAKIIFQ